MTTKLRNPHYPPEVSSVVISGCTIATHSHSQAFVVVQAMFNPCSTVHVHLFYGNSWPVSWLHISTCSLLRAGPAWHCSCSMP